MASPLEGENGSYLNARSALVYLLKMAAQEGILDPGAGLRTPAQISAATGSDTARIGVLCSSLVSYGILNQFGDAYMVSDRFRTIMPAEEVPQLTNLLDAEDVKLSQMRKAGETIAPPLPQQPSALETLLKTQLRQHPEPGVAGVLGWAGHLRDLPVDLVVKDLRPAEAPPAEASVAPSLETLLGDTAAAEPAKRKRGKREPVEAEVMAKIRTPAPPSPAPALSVSPIGAAALGAALVKNWPIGPQSGEAITTSVRRLSRMKPAEKRSLRYHLGTFLWLIAAVCILWAAWDLWGTGIGQAAAQKDLKADFAKTLAQPETSDDPAVPDSVPGDAPAPVAFRDLPPAPLPGTGVALLKIESLGVEQVVLEGTGVADLKRGPGHYRGTPLPGQPGNSAIAGHRTTYGAPFFKLGKMKVGDDIKVETRTGNYLYRVSRIYTVEPTDSSPLLPTDENILTLTTCDPPFSAAKRLIVVATMLGEPDRTTPTVAPESIPVPTTVPAPVQSAAPDLNLRAIKQPGAAASPSPAAGKSPSPSPSPAAKQSPAPARPRRPAGQRPDGRHAAGHDPDHPTAGPHSAAGSGQQPVPAAADPGHRASGTRPAG